MATTIDRIHFALEANYPAILAAVSAVGAFVYAPQAIQAIQSHGWKLDSVYSSVFDVSAITTPFLFTFYSFVATTERGFIGRMKASIYYKLMMQYTVRALLLGGFLTLASIPMMIIEPAPTTTGGADHWLLVLWIGLAVWTLSSFARAAYIFSVFARNR